MCSLRRERDLEALVYELLERACLRFWSRAADVINNKWFSDALANRANADLRGRRCDAEEEE